MPSPIRRRRFLVAIAVFAAFAFVAIAHAADSPPPARQSFTLDSKRLGETRRINVATPAGYDAHASARYPVLYMPDGGLEEDFPHVADAVESLVAEGKIRPFILVGVENTERRRDLTPPTEVEENKKIAPHVGGSANFRAFLRDELMPHVRAHYRTTRETAIIGESLAGLFIVETFFVEPDLFDHYMALSPSLWWNGESLVNAAPAWLAAHRRLHKTLFLTSADEADIISGTARIADALRANPPAQLVWFHEPMPNEHHNTIFRASEKEALTRALGVRAHDASSRKASGSPPSS